MADNRQYTALEWVLGEIRKTLTQAGEALESHSQHSGDVDQLHFCLRSIQYVYGALRMLEFHNAATLAKEMELLTSALIGKDTVDLDEAKDVLRHSISQLPNYLDQLKQTRQEQPSTALSLINSLRAARGADLLDSVSLFTPNLNRTRQISGERSSITQDDKIFKSVAEKAKQMYQQATANIISKSDVDENLEYLSKVCDHLQKITKNTYQFCLWESAAALVEGLQRGVITLTPAIKKLFDHLDQELDNLSQQGVTALDKLIDEDLLKKLLYCIISAQGETQLIKAVRKNYGLNITHQQSVQLADVAASGSVVTAIEDDQPQSFAAQSANYRFDETHLAALRESRNALENVKDAITEYSATQWNIEHIKPTPLLLREISGGLLVFPLKRAAKALNACANYIEQQLIETSVSPDSDQLDNLADAIESVDCYLEYMLSSAGDDHEFLLAIAEKSMASLGCPVDVSIDVEETGSASALVDESVIPSDDEGKVIPEQVTGAEKADTTADDEDSLDDEIIEIFIEEAAEVLENIAEFLPQWMANFNDTDSLQEVRRAFHTLKGSGRMVGANDIGELSWSIENMLNRVIDKTIPTTESIVNLIQRVCDILGGMIKAFESHQPPPQQQLIEQYMAWGHQIASGDSVDVPAVTAADLVEDSSPNDLLEDIEQEKSHKVDVDDNEVVVADSQLSNIFINESSNHLDTVKRYIAEVEASMPIFHPPSDLMQRALHTLKGSALMIEILPLANLMAAMESFVKELRNYQVDINTDFLQLIKDCVCYTEAALLRLADNAMPEVSESQALTERVAELRESILGPVIYQQGQQDGFKQIDPRLLEQFMATEAHLLIEADVTIDSWQSGENQFTDWQAIIAELEKLSLAAKRANLPLMTRLSDALHSCYQYLISGEIESSDNCYDVLREGHATLLSMLDAVAAGQDVPKAEEELFSRLQSLSIDNKSTGADVSDQQASITPDTGVESGDKTGLIVAKSPQQNEKTDAVLSAEDTLDSDHQSDSASVADSTADDNSYINEEIDDELVGIFLDEANELSEEIDEIIHRWESDSSDTSNNASLQRSLHTLKGGAKMAGLMSLGDLAHRFEAFLVDNKDDTLTDKFFADVQKFQDQLHQAISSITSEGDNVQHPLNDSTIGDEEAEEDRTDSTSITDQPPVAKSAENSETARETSASVLPFVAKNAIPTPVTTPVNAVSADEPIKAKKTNTVQELLKVPADLMEELVNLAGETSISRGRMEEQVSEIGLSLDDMDMTVQRLQEQIRRLDIETEAQVLFRQEQMAVESSEFDPLEMDRYTQLQQLTRSLIESASDLMDLKLTLVNKIRDTETILLQQSRINTDLQEGLMRSRMVPFSSKVPRLRRIVRQVSSELNKSVSFEFDNAEGELDRSILEKMITPLEHMLRNAVYHGIEDEGTRVKLGKPNKGRITLNLSREGGDIVLRLADDGRGIDVDKVREKAIERKLMNADAQVNDKDILQFILHAGFSTADTVTQIAGRGVGMDVVSNEIKQIGGSLSIQSTLNEGTMFTIRLPFTVSVNRALLVVIGDDLYAVPLNTIEGIVLIKTEELKKYYSNSDTLFEYAGKNYQVRYLANIMNMQARPKLEDEGLSVPVLLVHSGDHRVALQVDQLQSSREIVVKGLSAQFNLVQGLSGVTIMGDGGVVVILDLHALIRRDMILDQQAPTMLDATSEQAPVDTHSLVMVVDDSVTVRKVTTRLLEREGFDVITAKDGVEAMNLLQDHDPNVMLLDIEMPRMDGFEVATNVRSSPRLKHLPIIMITSRTGEKHRQRGLDLGVNIYMGKPYQEEQLLENIRKVMQM